MKAFERIYNVSRYQVWETAKNSATSFEAAEKLGIPYKAFVKIAKSMDLFKEGERKNDVKLNEILEGLHPSYSTTRLKERLIEEKVFAYFCVGCGIVDWNSQPIVLQLDHIDGNNSNHRLDNLRLLCPNCHSQTDTYAGKNNKSSCSSAR